MTRKWISIRDQKPTEGQKVYYFCDFLGIFRGEYHYIKSIHQTVCPHKFTSNHGVLDGNDVSYWMPYDHSYRDMIPLPPDYDKVDIHNVQAIMNKGENFAYEEVRIPNQQQEFSFTFVQSGDINE